MANSCMKMIKNKKSEAKSEQRRARVCVRELDHGH